MSFLGLYDSDPLDNTKPYDVDTGAMEYGAEGGGAVRQRGYDDKADVAQGRQGPQIDYTNADESRGLGMQSRADMYGQMQTLRDRANGGGYSAGQAQLQAGRDEKRSPLGPATQ